MKSQLKLSIKITLAACLLIIVSCGKKNTTNSGTAGTSPFYSGNPALSSGSGSTIIDQYSKIKASTACLSGRNRLSNDVSFNITGNLGGGATIGGNWQPNFITNGSIGQLYVGVSAYRDLMFVTKVVSGAQVVGYNVTLSFCEVPNAYMNFPALVSNDRALVNFYAPNGITLSESANCGFGIVTQAINTMITSKASATNPYTMDYPVYTSFARPLCNGQ